MLDLKSMMIGALFGIAIIFILGASHKKEKKSIPTVGMFQFYGFHNN